MTRIPVKDVAESLGEAIVSSTVDAVVGFDLQQRVVVFNPAAERMFCITSGEILGQSIGRLIPARYRRMHARALAAFAGAGGAEFPPGGLAEMVGLRADGEEISLEASFSQIGVNGEKAFITVLRDVTARRHAEEALKEAQALLEMRVQERTAELQASNEALAEGEERYRRFFQAVSDAVLVVDVETKRIVDVNNGALRLFGYTREEFLKLKHLDLTAEPEKSAASFQAAAAGEVTHVPIRYYRKKDQTVFPVEISSSTFKARNRLMLCGLIRDITERLELQREILAISEQEQRRLGQDLHDDLCQQLAGIEFLSQTLAGSIASKCKATAAKAKEIARMVQHAMAQTRELARGLAPVSLEGDGLALALQELAARTSRLFLIDCRCRCDGYMPQLEAGAAVHLYRIAQEALGNAIKHGKARRVVISLAADGHRLALRVKDNGAGFPQKTPARGGMGLRIMQYRAEVIGGSLTLERASRGGTTVVCTVPGGFVARAPASRSQKP
jgi:two-component system CheB/CheR fusion protein